jgi:hypothetical protein
MNDQPPDKEAGRATSEQMNDQPPDKEAGKSQQRQKNKWAKLRSIDEICYV